MIHGNVVLVEDGLSEVMRLRSSNKSTNSKVDKRVISREAAAESFKIIDDADTFNGVDVADTDEIFSFNGVPFGIIGGGALEEDDEDDVVDLTLLSRDDTKKVKKKKKDKDKKKNKAGKDKDKNKSKKKSSGETTISAEKVASEKSKTVKITRDRYENNLKAKKKAEEERAKYEREKKQAEIDLIQLIARRDYIYANISKLDSSKKKDAIKIVQMNIELKHIETSIRALQEQYNIKMDSINHGSGMARSWNRFRRFVKNKWNGVRKWFKRNKDMIIGISSVVLPIIGSTIAASIIRG